MDIEICGLKHNNRSFSVKRSSRDSLQRIERFLYEGTRNPYLTSKVLQYEYLSCPLRAGGMYFLSDKDDELVATIGFLPHELRIRGEKTLSLMAERIFCVPNFRKTGLYSQFADAVIRSLRVRFKDCLLFGVTGVPKVLLANGFTASDCFENFRKTPDGGRQVVRDAQLCHLSQNELAKAADSFAGAWEGSCFLSYSQHVLPWLIYNNPFVALYPLSIHLGGKLSAAVVLRITSPGNARVVEFLCGTDSSIPECVAVLDAFFERNHLTRSFTVNTKHPGHQTIARELIAKGYEATIPQMYFIHDAESSRLAPNRSWVTGMWAPPYWAGSPVFKPAGYGEKLDLSF